MEYVYAALLLHKAGKPVNEKNISQVINATGIKLDPVKVKALVASLEEVDIEEALKATPALMAAAPATVAPTSEEPKAEAKEEKKEKEEEKKKKEEAALEGLGALFG